MDDDIWAALAAEAMRRSTCNIEGAFCRVIFHAGPHYAVLTHSSAAPHDCPICEPRTAPQHIVSVDSWQTTKRDALVARVARWLVHCHQGSDSTRADGSAAVDSGRLSASAGDTTAGSSSSDAAGTPGAPGASTAGGGPGVAGDPSPGDSVG